MHELHAMLKNIACYQRLVFLHIRLTICFKPKKIVVKIKSIFFVKLLKI